MSYEAALTKAWKDLEALSPVDRHSAGLLGDAYEIDLGTKRVFFTASNAPAKDYTVIILLHYLSASMKNHFTPSGEWVSFKDVEGGEFYYPAFREGAIKPLLDKYGADPSRLLEAVSRFNGKAASGGDYAIEIPIIGEISVRIIIWKGDEEFDPEVTMLFDKNITKIFPTEDIAVLARTIAHKL